MVGAIGHGDDIVDAINTCNIRYLMMEMCMIGTPEAHDRESRMNTNSIVEKST